MDKIRPLLVLFITLAGILWIWRVFVADPEKPEELGFAIENSRELVGCYYRGRSEVRIANDRAFFGDDQSRIWLRSEKGFGEVLVPDRYPWFDTKTGKFEMQNDDFAFLDLSKNSDGIWQLKMYTTDYLRSRDPNHLKEVSFTKGDCSRVET